MGYRNSDDASRPTLHRSPPSLRSPVADASFAVAAASTVAPPPLPQPPASADAILSKEEVKKWDGSQPPTEDEPIPRIVVGAGIYYYDCSYGGCPFYGPGGPYNVMAGEDATWALAKMEVGKVARCDLTEKERGVLDGWIKVFERKYVRVGRTGNEVIKDSQS